MLNLDVYAQYSSCVQQRAPASFRGDRPRRSGSRAPPPEYPKNSIASMAACRRLPLPNDLERPHRPRPRTGIRDYDLIYFDEDLSWAAEDAVIQGVAAATLGLSVPWRRAIRPVCISGSSRASAALTPTVLGRAALRQYASVVHAVGVRLEDDGRLDVAAPFGLDDVFAMGICPNRALDNAVSHRAKAQRAQAIWLEVTVIRWDDAAAGL